MCGSYLYLPSGTMKGSVKITFSSVCSKGQELSAKSIPCHYFHTCAHIEICTHTHVNLSALCGTIVLYATEAFLCSRTFISSLTTHGPAVPQPLPHCIPELAWNGHSTGVERGGWHTPHCQAVPVIHMTLMSHPFLIATSCCDPRKPGCSR